MVIAAAGFEADASTLKKVIQRRNVTYQHNHKKPMSVAAAAQLVGNTLYYKRFFPYYSFTLVAGLDTEGRLGWTSCQFAPSQDFDCAYL